MLTEVSASSPQTCGYGARVFSQRSLRSLPARVSARLRVGLIVGLTVLGAACVQEEAVPIDPANPPTTPAPNLGDLPDVSHPLQVTDQMKELARQQCLDDPDLAEGYVSAVDPETDEILVDYSISCESVRS